MKIKSEEDLGGMNVKKHLFTLLFIQSKLKSNKFLAKI